MIKPGNKISTLNHSAMGAAILEFKSKNDNITNSSCFLFFPTLSSYVNWTRGRGESPGAREASTSTILSNLATIPHSWATLSAVNMLSPAKKVYFLIIVIFLSICFTCMVSVDFTYFGHSLLSLSIFNEPLMRKRTKCLGENKGVDQLCSNCTADQNLCFRYTDSTIYLLPKISSL